jgi:hypothetical protein
LANDNGVCPVSEEYVLDNLVLSGLYYEPSRLFIPQEVLDKSVLLESTTPEPVVAPEPEAEPEVTTDSDISEENRQQILTDLESRFPGISKHLQNISLQKHDEEIYLYDPELKEWGTEGLNMSVESFI